MLGRDWIEKRSNAEDHRSHRSEEAVSRRERPTQVGGGWTRKKYKGALRAMRSSSRLKPKLLCKVLSLLPISKHGESCRQYLKALIFVQKYQRSEYCSGYRGYQREGVRRKGSVDPSILSFRSERCAQAIVQQGRSRLGRTMAWHFRRFRSLLFIIEGITWFERKRSLWSS